MLAALFVVLPLVSGCGPIQSREYLSGDVVELPTGEVMTADYCRQGIAVCDRILAKNPDNQFALANRAHYESKLRAMADYEENTAKFNAWYGSLTTMQRVQLNDWVRHYEALRNLGYAAEDAFVKSTQLYGKPVKPPLSPPSGEKYFREAYDALQNYAT